jgi:hypothetical protein
MEMDDNYNLVLMHFTVEILKQVKHKKRMWKITEVDKLLDKVESPVNRLQSILSVSKNSFQLKHELDPLEISIQAATQKSLMEIIGKPLEELLSALEAVRKQQEKVKEITNFDANKSRLGKQSDDRPVMIMEILGELFTLIEKKEPKAGNTSLETDFTRFAEPVWDAIEMDKSFSHYANIWRKNGYTKSNFIAENIIPLVNDAIKKK